MDWRRKREMSQKLAETRYPQTFQNSPKQPELSPKTVRNPWSNWKRCKNWICVTSSQWLLHFLNPTFYSPDFKNFQTIILPSPQGLSTRGNSTKYGRIYVCWREVHPQTNTHWCQEWTSRVCSKMLVLLLVLTKITNVSTKNVVWIITRMLCEWNPSNLPNPKPPSRSTVSTPTGKWWQLRETAQTMPLRWRGPMSASWWASPAPRLPRMRLILLFWTTILPASFRPVCGGGTYWLYYYSLTISDFSISRFDVQVVVLSDACRSLNFTFNLISI